MNTIRLNKYIASCGLASRRGAEKMIEEGRVTINCNIAALTTPVEIDDNGRAIGVVAIDGEVISPVRERVVIALYKPEGVVCTEANFEGEITLKDIVDYPTRLFSIGCLDKNSEGLILMTNDGDLAQEISKSSNNHEKEYIVKINKQVTTEFIKKMSGGVEIVLDDDAHVSKSDKNSGKTDIQGKVVKTKPCKVKKLSADTFSIILTQGFNRQIRRMCEACGARVLNLRRVRIDGITLGKLNIGTFRKLDEREIDKLFR